MIGSRTEALESTKRRLIDFIALTKPRLVPMVLVATAAGYYLAARSGVDVVRLLHLLLGTTLTTGGTLALNQAYEEDIDTIMVRTRTRPLPSGRLMRIDAIFFGLAATAAGLLYLAALVNPISAGLTLLTGIFYLLLYTPMKRFTPLNSIIGAIPGAMPPVIGWAAAAGSLSIESFVLFAILFIWQIPHALAIAIMFQDDFKNAGVRLLPVDEPDGRSTGRQVVSYCLALLPAGMMPTLIGLAGGVYFFVSLTLGLVFLAFGIHLGREHSIPAARKLFFASLIYLPIVLMTMVLDPGYLR